MPIFAVLFWYADTKKLPVSVLPLIGHVAVELSLLKLGTVAASRVSRIGAGQAPVAAALEMASRKDLQ